MEQDQQRRSNEYSPLNSPDSGMTTSNAASPATPRTPQLNISIPPSDRDTAQEKVNPKAKEDNSFWDEDDDGYWGEMDEDEEEDLEETYRSVL